MLLKAIEVTLVDCDRTCPPLLSSYLYLTTSYHRATPVQDKILGIFLRSHVAPMIK